MPIDSAHLKVALQEEDVATHDMEGDPDLHALKAEIIERAHELGFDLVRFARVGAMPETLSGAGRAD